MATYNILGSQFVDGTDLQDRFYAFTYDGDLSHVLADATIPALSWTTAIRTSLSDFLTLSGVNVQISSDFFDGGGKNDFIYGSDLNDAIFYNNGVISGGIGSFSSIEQIEMGAGDDIVDLSAQGPSGVDYSKGIIIRGNAGNDTIIGGAGKDTIYGDDGNDLLIGWRGSDTIYGGTGDDIIYGDDFGFNGIAGDDFLYGQAGNDILYGGARTDRLDGGDGNDILYGGLGGDNLYGGTGDDILYGDDVGTSGNDKLFGEGGQDQLYGGGGSDELHGGTGDDFVDGGDGNDFVDGDSGNDILVGNAGDDILDGGADIDIAAYSGNLSDYAIALNPDGSFTVTDTRAGSPDGVDTIRNVEFFMFADGAIPAGVTTSPPTITSNGGGGSASLSVAENGTSVTTVMATDPDSGQTLTYSISGGADHALFAIDAATGAVSFINAPDFETPGDAGRDNVYDITVRATNSSGAFDSQDISITVTDVDETGRTITGSSGNNTFSPTATNTAFQTTSLNDTIFALAGNDIIDGGAGVDRMEGGIGNDIYFVDQFSDDGSNANDDLVIELASSGIDLVNSTVSYILPAEVENLTLLGAAAINGTGNGLDNVITGNNANNILSGGAGADKLDGRGGADIMSGGDDNDEYFVDTYSDDGIADNDDQVIEFAGGGIDTVNSSVSFALGAEVEHLRLTGADATNGTGNGLANTLTGNSAANILLGLDGADTINGNAGDDIIRGGNGNDTINGGADNDAIYGDAGTDTLLGGAGNDLLEGGAGNDTLNGQAGEDILVGGIGRDSMTGGTENDIFSFNFGETTTSSATIDIILDFVTGADKINLDFVTGGLAASAYSETMINNNVYSNALASAQAMSAGGKSVGFVAGTTDGWLFWDTNTDGIMDQSILLKGLGSLGAFDHTDIM